MATSTARLPITRRIQQKLADLYKDKDCRVPDAVNLPPSIDKRRNVQVERFHTQHRAVGDWLITRTMQSWINSRFDKSKEELVKILEIKETELDPGHRSTLVFDNVALNIRVDNGQWRLDTDKLRTTLMMDYGFSLDKANEAIQKSLVQGKNPLHLVPSTTT